MGLLNKQRGEKQLCGMTHFFPSSTKKESFNVLNAIVHCFTYKFTITKKEPPQPSPTYSP